MKVRRNSALKHAAHSQMDVIFPDGHMCDGTGKLTDTEWFCWSTTNVSETES